MQQGEQSFRDVINPLVSWPPPNHRYYNYSGSNRWSQVDLETQVST